MSQSKQQSEKCFQKIQLKTNVNVWLPLLLCWLSWQQHKGWQPFQPPWTEIFQTTSQYSCVCISNMYIILQTSTLVSYATIPEAYHTKVQVVCGALWQKLKEWYNTRSLGMGLWSKWRHAVGHFDWTYSVCFSAFHSRLKANYCDLCTCYVYNAYTAREFWGLGSPWTRIVITLVRGSPLINVKCVPTKHNFQIIDSCLNSQHILSFCLELMVFDINIK